MTSDIPTPASRLADLPESFVLLARQGSTAIEWLTGEVADVANLADIPLMNAGEPREVFAMVPYRQVAERGFSAHEDDTPLRTLTVTRHESFDREAFIAALPSAPLGLSNAEFDVTDEAYAEIVQTVIADEIGRGEGANFVIRRDFEADVNADPVTAALTWFRALLEHERGAYWTFAVVTPGHIAVGASPEAHVVARDGVVTMNPISGTFRHPEGGATKANLSEFLASTKETEELFMVVDEELKMMAQVCSDGGRITGPHLKEMSRLTHTEYMLTGHSRLDPRDILRETMFAPTVTGSPMQNACTVIQRHETKPRGYYSGVAALFTPNASGGHDLDAPILIRTVYVDDVAGTTTLRVPVGATLVRHSDPHGEVSETHGKAAGILSAIGAIDALASSGAAPVRLGDDPEIQALLAARNHRLADFWLNPQTDAPTGPFSGTAVVVDAEDRFTTMLAHQLRHLGFDANVIPWNAVTDEQLDAADLVVAGPGPGDPRDGASVRINRMREVVERRLEQRKPLVAVCLSHQIVSDRFGLSLEPLASPHQGLQKTVDIFGTPASIGFYNTFTARMPDEVPDGVQIAAEANGDVYALRGSSFATVQGHLESILSRDGLTTLENLVAHALIDASQ